MPRDCTCDKTTIGAAEQPGDCHLCFLYHNDDRYRAMWDRTSPPEARPKKQRLVVPCIHATGEVDRIQCSTCSGKVMVKIIGCDLHGECTLSKELGGRKTCLTCHDYQPQEADE